MILAKLKVYGLFILGILATVLYAMLKGEQTKRYKDKVKTAHAVSKTLVQANKAINEAEKKGRQKLHEDDPNRNHFDS